MTIFVYSTLFFVGLHVIIAWRSSRPFHVDLRLSRGIAAAILSAIGFYSLIRWFELWPFTFLVPQSQESLAFSFICFLNGHLIADFIWLAYGALRAGSNPRVDLVAHHLLGIVVTLSAWYLGIGYTMICVALTSELMPVTTGLGALGQSRGWKKLEQATSYLRVVVLVGWRIPLWIVVVVLLTWELVTRGPREEILTVYPIAFVAAFALIGLDIYWTRACLNSLRKSKQVS